MAITINREEIIWAAGLFDGEGCISMSPKSSGNVTARLRLAMTDEDSVRRFHKAVGYIGNITYVQQRRHWKPQWAWAVGGFVSVQAVIAFLYPWLNLRRQARAREVLSATRSSGIRIKLKHCTVPGCTKPVNGRMLCNTHYSRCYYHVTKGHTITIRELKKAGLQDWWHSAIIAYALGKTPPDRPINQASS